MKKIYFSFAFILLFLFSHAQNNSVWTAKLTDEKVFIENKGQFPAKYNDGYGDVLFESTQSGINMCWSAKGLTYVFAEKYLSDEAKREIEKDGEQEEAWEKAEIKYHHFHMKWIGANPNPQVVSENPVSFYYTYSNPKDEKN